jgi:hypothetical protein
LPGLTGKILESKHERDNQSIPPKSRMAKIFATIIIVCICLAMMFYILLFALLQTQSKQNAWFHSFILWLFVEIFLVSTFSVLLNNIVIPSFAMKDVFKIKLQIMASIHDYRKSMGMMDIESPKLARKGNNKGKLSNCNLYKTIYMTRTV